MSEPTTAPSSDVDATVTKLLMRFLATLAVVSVLADLGLFAWAATR